MKDYPSIPGPAGGQHSECYAFVKYDGTNIRAEWSRKRGWYKFGTRAGLFDHTHPVFGTAPGLFLQKYGDDLTNVFKTEKLFRGVQNFIVFFEWFGAQSLAGAHKPDDKFDVVLFDVNPNKMGFLAPKQLLDCFGHLKIAEVVYQGNYGPALIEAVKNETIDIVSKYDIKAEIPEGVVCKGTGRALRGSNTNPWMAKIKTKRYKDALKALYEADWLKYWGIDEEY